MSGRRKLDYVLTASTLLVSIGALYAIASSAQTQSASSSYSPGDSFGNLPGIRFDDVDATVVLWLDSGCTHCAESVDLYRRLDSRSGRVRLVAAGEEEVSALERFLGQFQVRVDRVTSVPLGSFHFLGTPTIVVVGPRGKVIRAWPGHLKPDAERELFRLAGVELR